MTQPNIGTHRFPVQSGHILLFARAIGDLAADETDYATAVAPPTFGYAHHQFLSRFVLRPQPGTPWMGSGRGDSGADATGFEAALHAEQEFTYYRPIRAGLNLLVTTTDGPSWAKARRDSGHLAFASAITELRDEASGELVQTARQVAVIIRSGPVPEGTPDTPPAASPSESASAGDSAALPDVGEKRKLVIFDGLTRTQLVMYAGAGGDYNPLHTDEIFAMKVAGYPSVFAHGMLTMGASGRVLTDWVGADLIRSYRAQFRGQVWPGDTLTVTATVDSRPSDSAVVSLTTTNQDGGVVMTGNAVLGSIGADVS
jgi:peroxisomal enoyl-CoA hydratase 2